MASDGLVVPAFFSLGASLADSQASVGRRLYGPLVAHLPPFLFDQSVLGLELWQWLGGVVVLAASLLAGYFLQRAVLRVAMGVARLTRATWDDAVVVACRGPLSFALFAFCWAGGTRLLLLPTEAQALADLLAHSVFIVAVARFLLRVLRVAVHLVQQHVEKDGRDPSRVRGLRTQLVVLQHVGGIATWVVTAALLLMQFAVVRNVGVSLLASAGIAGLVVGLAAQKSIATLLAGMQLTFTQPIRIGDQVVVESESGTVEEITLTFVVLRLWDERRLVVPITYFLEKPFQNWSRSTPELLGTVTWEVDFTADMDALRKELGRILSDEGRELWDKRVQKLHVTEVKDKSLTVRALVSAASPDRCWELRCLVRERMVMFLHRMPHWLPTVRTGPVPAQGPKA